MMIQKMRLKRGWSQQQLADASGLNVRTIQRIEAGQPASMETMKALAAVFEVDYSTLAKETDMTEPSPEQRAEEDAFRQVRRLRKFYLHLIRYGVIAGALVGFNYVFAPAHIWAWWVAGGWGLGLVMHGVSVFGRQGLLGPQWERREVERRLGRSLQ